MKLRMLLLAAMAVTCAHAARFPSAGSAVAVAPAGAGMQSTLMLGSGILLPFQGSWTQEGAKWIFEGSFNTGQMSLQQLADYIVSGYRTFQIEIRATQGSTQHWLWMYSSKPMKFNRRMTAFHGGAGPVKCKIKCNKQTGLYEVRATLNDAFLQRTLQQYLPGVGTWYFNGFSLIQ